MNKLLFYSKTIATILVIVICPFRMEAQWQKLSGPTTSVPYCFTSRPGKIYLGTTAGIYYSNDNGNSWIEFPHNDNYAGFPKALEATTDALYMTTYSASLGRDIMLRTYDEGQTWERVLIFDYGNINNDWVGKDILVLGDTILCYLNDAGMTSVDNGESFFLNALSTGGGVYDYGGYWPFKGYVYAMTGSGAVIKSPDNGVNWIFSFYVPGGGYCLAAIGNKLFAGGSGGLYSTGDGINWDTIKNVNFEYTSRVFGEGQSVYVICNDGVYNSNDGGIIWAKVANQPPLNQVHFARLINGRLFFADYSGLHVSDSGWNGLQKVPLEAANTSCVVKNNGRLFTVTSGGYYYSENQGSTWSAFQSDIFDPAYNYWFTPSAFFKAGGTLYTRFSYRNRLARSDDNGNTWLLTTEISQPANYIVDVVFEGNTLFAITPNQLFRSFDKSQTWEEILYETPQTFSGLTNLEFNQGRLVMVRSYGEIFISSDGGDSWEKITDPPASGLISRVTAAYPYNDRLWVSTNIGLFVYDLTSHQWLSGFPQLVPADTSDAPFAQPPYVRFFKEVDGRLISSVIDNGLYILQPDNSWKKILNQPSNHRISSLFSENGEMYLGMAGGGIWKSSTDVLPVAEPGEATPLVLSPNPASNHLIIHTGVSSADDGLLSIRNAGGTLARFRHLVLEPDVLEDVQALPDGVYSVSIVTKQRVMTGKFIKIR